MQIVFAGICAGGAQKWAFLPQSPAGFKPPKVNLSDKIFKK